jgi:hypothetical protein
MLPTGIQPYIIEIVNNSTTTAYPVVFLDAYNTLAYTNANLFTWTITITLTSLPRDEFFFSYVDANGVLNYTGSLKLGDVFSYVGLLAPIVIIPLPSTPNGYTALATPVTAQNFYQNNSNIAITMNANMNCTYQQFLEATMTNPFSMDTFYFSSNNASQIAQDNPIEIFFKDINGDQAQKELPIIVNPYQSSGEGVIIQNQNVIDGFTGFQIPSLLPLTSIQLYLYPTKRAEQKLIKNKEFIDKLNNVSSIKQNSLNEFNNFIRNRKKRLGLD